jgi:hypothetical protein
MSKFSLSGLFSSKFKSNKGSKYIVLEEKNEHILSVKFKNASFDWDWFYNNDIYDERMLLLEESRSLVDPVEGREYIIYQWIKNDNDYVEEGDVLFLIRYAPYTNIHGYERVAILPPFKSLKSGRLTIKKHQDKDIFDGDIICEIEKVDRPKDLYNLNEKIYNFYFNKYDIPENIRKAKYVREDFGMHFDIKNHESDKIYLLEWLVADQMFAKEGEPLLKVGAIHQGKTIFNYILKAKVSGFVYQILPNQYGERLTQDNLLCYFFKTSEDLHKTIYSNTSHIDYDDFTEKKIIKWDIVGGHVLPFNSTDLIYNIGAVIADSVNSNSNLMFSLENHDSQDFIVFKFFSDEYKLNTDDEIQFMYEDKTLDKFQVVETAKKISSPWSKLYETKIPLTQNELNNLKEKEFIKWRIEFKGSSESITGINSNDRFSGELFSRIVNDFAKEYVDLVTVEIPDYRPLFNRETNNALNPIIEECHVYLMHDTTNNFHKIGISNKPEYREKTLQGDKPTIELICSKEFPNRGIAKSIEQALHGNYASKRIRGEWFELNNNDVTDIQTTLK